MNIEHPTRHFLSQSGLVFGPPGSQGVTLGCHHDIPVAKVGSPPEVRFRE